MTRSVFFSSPVFGLHAAVLAQLGELFPERFEFSLRRIVAVEHLAGIVAIGKLGQHLGGFGRDQIELDVGADAAEVDAADLRLAGISKHRGGEFEFVLGQRFGGRRRFEIRGRVVVRVEADRVDLPEIGRRGLGALVGGAIAYPQRRVIARLVECLDAFAIGLAVDDTVELLAGNHLAQLIGDRAVGGGRHRRRGRLARRLGRFNLGGLGRGRGGFLLRLDLGRFSSDRLGLGGLVRRHGSWLNVLRGQRRKQSGIRHWDSGGNLIVRLLRQCFLSVAGMGSQ